MEALVSKLLLFICTTFYEICNFDITRMDTHNFNVENVTPFSAVKNDGLAFSRCPIRFPDLQVKAIKSIEISTCFVQETHPTPQRCELLRSATAIGWEGKSDRNLQMFPGRHPSMPHKKIKNTISGNKAKILYTALMQYIYIYIHIHIHIHTYIYIYMYVYIYNYMLYIILYLHYAQELQVSEIDISKINSHTTISPICFFRFQLFSLRRLGSCTARASFGHSGLRSGG